MANFLQFGRQQLAREREREAGAFKRRELRQLAIREERFREESTAREVMGMRARRLSSQELREMDARESFLERNELEETAKAAAREGNVRILVAAQQAASQRREAESSRRITEDFVRARREQNFVSLWDFQRRAALKGLKEGQIRRGLAVVATRYPKPAGRFGVMQRGKIIVITPELAANLLKRSLERANHLRALPNLLSMPLGKVA
ncbi:TPA: hypothetical protein HA244_04295 [Candidatus Micrarchaeota archaeon]|nr:hypothetical protein [Candidatus Micrarchaeota archaeon]